jgi:DNA mismatch repair ATPase MutS
MVGDGRGHDNELVDDLRRLLERVMAPVSEAMGRYISVQTRALAALEAELSFLLNGVALIEQLRATGLPVCRPRLAPLEERISCFEGAYNVSLALRLLRKAGNQQGGGAAAIVTNRVAFDQSHGRIWILTGPNRGGKTTYARAVGLAHLLFQAGLYVPARDARMSPVDAVFTYFPSRESATPGEGRLDEEARALAEIFREATPYSLILLNEALAGTSTLEALALAHDAVRGLRLLGARTIYVTHLHELAGHVEEINQTTSGDATVGSLVAEVSDEGSDGRTGHRRTFRIRPGPPLGLSYASEIAEQHGISYPQLVRLLESRGLAIERSPFEAPR